jgi:hypothetical protein
MEMRLSPIIGQVGRAVVIISFLSGCASWSGHGVPAPSSQKLRIAVLPLQIDVVINASPYFEIVRHE